MDLDGGGHLAMVRLDPEHAGYQERTEEGWGPFRTFASNPGVDFTSPQLEPLDLNGDGADDRLLTRGDHLLWYPSLGKHGWGAAQRIPLPDDPTLCWAGSPQCHPGALRHTSPFGTQKPYLLQPLDNGTGLTRTLTYGSSTAHYLRDRSRGRPWPTRLPFPSRSSTRSTFGLVETQVTETFSPGRACRPQRQAPRAGPRLRAEHRDRPRPRHHRGVSPGRPPTASSSPTPCSTSSTSVGRTSSSSATKRQARTSRVARARADRSAVRGAPAP